MHDHEDAESAATQEGKERMMKRLGGKKKREKKKKSNVRTKFETGTPLVRK